MGKQMNMTRREWLAGVAGVGGLGLLALAGCQGGGSQPVMSELPDFEREGFPVPAPVVPSGPPSQPPPQIKPLPVFGPGTFGVYPRSTWTSIGPNMSRITPMNGVNKITFHHSGDQHNKRDVPFLADGFRETLTHLELVRQYHTDGKGWGDIGYHFAIDRMGRVFQLRSLRYQGAHVSHHDEHNLGIVVLGNFNVQEPTAAQKERIKTFGRLARTEYAVGIGNVFTHRELMPTDCPGRRMQPYMVAVRNQRLI